MSAAQALVDARIEVLWRSPTPGGGGTWYAATVSAYDPAQEPLCHLLSYDDGEREWCDLESLEWRNLGGGGYGGRVEDVTGDNTLDGIPEIDGESTSIMSASSLSNASSAHAGPTFPGQHRFPPAHASGRGPPHPVCSGDNTFTSAQACASAQLLS